MVCARIETNLFSTWSELDHSRHLSDGVLWTTIAYISRIYPRKETIKGDMMVTAPLTVMSENDPKKGTLQDTVTVNCSSINMIRPGRPDIETIITKVTTSYRSPGDRVIIGACGPRELIAAAQTAVNNNLHNEALSTTFYCEVSLSKIQFK